MILNNNTDAFIKPAYHGHDVITRPRVVTLSVSYAYHKISGYYTHSPTQLYQDAVKYMHNILNP